MLGADIELRAGLHRHLHFALGFSCEINRVRLMWVRSRVDGVSNDGVTFLTKQDRTQKYSCFDCC